MYACTCFAKHVACINVVILSVYIEDFIHKVCNVYYLKTHEKAK